MLIVNGSIKKTIHSLQKHFFLVEYFDSSISAVNAILSEIPKEKSVGIGGSFTIYKLGLIKKLIEKGNKTFYAGMEKNAKKADRIRTMARNADIYLSGINALTENGEIINIDGIGNRVSSVIYGHEKVFLICGKDKITANVSQGLKLIKKNVHIFAARKKAKTPCTKDGKCHNCNSKNRICRIITILERMPIKSNIKIIIINDNFGF